MSTLFISDLHLEDAKPQLTAILLRFLQEQAREADALYLLGDIFEVWIGDDAREALMETVAHALKAVAESGTKVFFMHGNRDFLLRDAFAQRAGMTLIKDPTVISLGGLSTLLTHGDRYCTNDVAYQAFRARSRTPRWQSRFLMLPLFVRKIVARYARYKSKKYQQSLEHAMGDVVASEVTTEMNALNVKRLIHGHTHRPMVHSVALAHGMGERIVLADWREHGEALEVRDDGSFVRHTLFT